MSRSHPEKALLVAFLCTAAAPACTTSLPGDTPRAPLDAAARERAYEAPLREIVHKLAGDIGERNLDHPAKLDEAAVYLEGLLAGTGLAVRKQTYAVKGHPCHNLEVEVKGGRLGTEVVVVGGHYDSAIGTPGADDNASGTAATVVLARAFAKARPARALRFVLWTNEEEPYFWTDAMGSLVYARDLAAKKTHVFAALSLETMAYFKDDKGTQHYIFPLSVLYPSEGNFLAFVGDGASESVTFGSMRVFRGRSMLPAEAASLPGLLPGVGWSDHWSFWQEGWPGVMVTDTAPFRNPNYHEKTDTPDTLDYPRFARAVAGLESVVDKLANP